MQKLFKESWGQTAMDVKKATLKELFDRLALLLKGSKRAYPLRDLFRSIKRKEKSN